MNRWKQRLTTDWHPMRMLRMFAGIILLVAAINGKDYLMGLLSILLLYQGIANVGCCGSACSYTPPQKGEAEKFEFEEIKEHKL